MIATLTTVAQDRVCVLVPAATQGRLEAAILKERLKSLRLSGCRRVVLDLGNIEDMDLVAIGSLLEESRSYRREEGRLLVVEMARRIYEKCAQFGALFGIELFDSQSEAMQALGGG